MTADPLAPPSRIAMVGDWHANTHWATHAIRSIADMAGRADVIIHLGDFGYDYPASYLTSLERELKRAGVPLIFVDGNHECFPILNRYRVQPNGLRKLTDHIWHAPRGARWTWRGVKFVACGGAHSVDRPYRVPGESWWRDETITDDDVRRCVDGGPADILIAHDCPAGVVIPGIDDRTSPPPFPPLELLRAQEHREQLRRVVDACRPSWIWHGHYHRRYQATADFGYGPVYVTGLDCDGTSIESNVQFVELFDYVREPQPMYTTEADVVAGQVVVVADGTISRVRPEVER